MAIGRNSLAEKNYYPETQSEHQQAAWQQTRLELLHDHHKVLS